MDPHLFNKNQLSIVSQLMDQDPNCIQLLDPNPNQDPIKTHANLKCCSSVSQVGTIGTPIVANKSKESSYAKWGVGMYIVLTESLNVKQISWPDPTNLYLQKFGVGSIFKSQINTAYDKYEIVQVFDICTVEIQLITSLGTVPTRLDRDPVEKSWILMQIQPEWFGPG